MFCCTISWWKFLNSYTFHTWSHFVKFFSIWGHLNCNFLFFSSYIKQTIFLPVSSISSGVAFTERNDPPYLIIWFIFFITVLFPIPYSFDVLSHLLIAWITEIYWEHSSQSLLFIAIISKHGCFAFCFSVNNWKLSASSPTIWIIKLTAKLIAVLAMSWSASPLA